MNTRATATAASLRCGRSSRPSLTRRSKGHSVDEAIFRLRAPRHEPRETRFLTWLEVEDLAAATVEPYGNLVQLAALTGLRQGELFALRDRSADLRVSHAPKRARPGSLP